MKFGAHMPTSGGVWRGLERGVTTGCEVVQLFVKNNMQWSGRAFTPAELERYQAQEAKARFAAVFGHAGYLINLAAPPSPNRDKSLQSLILELSLAAQLNLPFLVLHPGSHLGRGEEAGLDQLVRGLDEVLAATADSPVRIALENTAGQGACLGARLEHLAAAFQRVKCPARLAVCLDTAHCFAAGYPVHTAAGWDAALAEAERLFGLNQIVAFHLNDSKTALGSRVDRHAGIGQGLIGRAGFQHLVNDHRFRDTPGCLETPKSPDLHEDLENLAILRSLIRAPAGAPDAASVPGQDPGRRGARTTRKPMSKLPPAGSLQERTAHRHQRGRSPHPPPRRTR